MSKKINLFAILVLALMVMFTVSCEGPAGPAGPEGVAGVAGADGAAGADGTPGVDGNVSCLACHTQSNMDAIDGLFALSGHSAGNYVGYAGGRGSCARCHSSEGFGDYLAGYWTEADGGADIPYPSAWSCETCHGNHKSLEDGISAPLQTMMPVTMIEDGTVIDFDGASNLCANCHQSRRGSAYYEAIDTLWTEDVNGNDSIDWIVPDGSVYINSSHAGPHHGPQTNTLNGMSGFGNSSTGAHLTAGCVGCHMGAASATEGGHSFIPNLENCTSCHTTVTDVPAFLAEKQGAVTTRMNAIAEALVTAGALGGDATDGYHPNVGVVTQDQFEAFWNWMVVYEDHSHGVHNPGYFNTLLTIAETKLGL